MKILTAVFYVVIAVLSSFSTSLSYKFACRRKLDHLSAPCLLCGITSVLIAVFYFVLAVISRNTLSVETVLCSLIGGGSYFIAAFCYLNALYLGPFAVTAALLNFSNLLPVVYSAVFLKGQSLRAVQMIGLSVLALSVVALATSKKTVNKGEKFSLKWLMWIVPMFISNSFINFGSRLQVYTTGSTESFYYGMSTFMVSAFLCGVTFFVLGGQKAVDAPKLKRNLTPAICLALSLGVNLIAHLRLPAMDIPAAIQYPIVSGSSSILALIVGVIAFGDRIRFYGYLGVGGGIAAMILLNM